MRTQPLLTASLIALIALPAPGCGLFRRRRTNETNVSTSVSVAQTGRDIATVEREQYEVLDISSGEATATRWFFLTVPVGGQTTSAEVEENAYYAAVGKVSGCDALTMAHAKHRRVVVPLLLVNIVRYEASVRGRCVAIKDDLQIEGKAPSTRESTKLEASAPVQPAAPPPAE